MHKKLFSWLTIVGFLSAFAVSAIAQAPAAAAPAPAAPDPANSPKIGMIRVTRVVGDVTFEDVNTKVKQVLINNQEITQGNIVRTGENSSVVLLFGNGASINLAHTSELNIEQFTQNPFDGEFKPSTATEEPSVSVTSIKLTRGELVGNVKKLRASQGSKFTIGTPVGAAGIRGTTFRIVYRPTGTGQAFNFTITTVEGNVEIQVASGTVTAPPVSVTNNQEIVINNVEVNPVTNVVTVTNANNEVVNITTTPPPTVNSAPVTSVQLVQSVATNLATEVLNVTFTAPTTNAPPSTGSGNGSGGGSSGNGGTSGGGDGTGGTGNNGGTGTNNNGTPPPDPNTNNNNPSGNNGNNSNNNNNSGSPGGTTTTPRLTNNAGG